MARRAECSRWGEKLVRAAAFRPADQRAVRPVSDGPWLASAPVADTQSTMRVGRSANGETVNSAITIDLHKYNDPRDIDTASVWLAAQQISATFFVPSMMFEDAAMKKVLRELPALGHEVGSHSHHHNPAEVDAIVSGGVDDLGFLSVSRDLYGEFYGTAPRAVSGLRSGATWESRLAGNCPAWGIKSTRVRRRNAPRF